MVVSVPGVYVDNISIGDFLTFQDGPGIGSGGEYITFGIPFKVVDISGIAVLGGNPPSGDLLSPETAYLYHNFRYGILSNYDYGSGGPRDFCDAVANCDLGF